MDAATDESDSSVHFHSAAPAVQCASPEDPTIRLSLLSSLTITGGFNVWGAGRSSATPAAASRGESTTSTPRAGNVRRVPLWPPTHIQQQQQQNVCQSSVSEGEGSDVLWHRPPPPPPPPTADSGRSPSPHNAGNKSETTRVATPAAAEVVVESEATGRAAQTQPSADKAASPTCNPRRRTVRAGLSSATPAAH